MIFLADDLGYGDLGCYGNRSFATPRLDRMAAEGTRLTEFYAMPTCTPSRAALLTGRYPIRSGLVRVAIPREHFGVPDSEITLAEALKAAGYRTACIGKWHLGDLPRYRPNRHGFDYYYGLLYSHDMTLAPRVPALRLYRDNRVVESPVRRETLTRRYTEQALWFIEENRRSPFLLYLPYSMPHTPLSASESFRGKSIYGPYGDAVEEVDWSVGQVLDCLKRHGLEENTLTVFASDNGPVLQARGRGGSAGVLRGGKSTTWEGGVRVPCLLRWPQQVPSNTVRPGLANVMDLFATCVELAGHAVPGDRPVDGRNLMPFLQGVSGPVHMDFVYYLGAHLCAIRSGQWKLHLMMREYKGQGKFRPLEKSGAPQLYDLDNDPGEAADVSREYPGVVETLRRAASEFQAAVVAGTLPKPYWRSLLPRIRKRK